MPRTFFDLNLLANIAAKLGNIVGEHVKFDMFANNVGQFGHTFTNTVLASSWSVGPRSFIACNAWRNC